MKKEMENNNLYSKIAIIINKARNKVLSAISTTMVYTYFK